jgi:long-chain acyl-CoA synthetase
LQVKLTQGLRRASQQHAGRLAAIDETRHCTWRELENRVARLSAGLTGLGLEPGGRVGFIAMNSVRSIETLFAILWAGGIACPVNYRLSPHEMIAQLRDAEPAVLVIGEDFQDRAAGLRDGLPGLKAIVVMAQPVPGSRDIFYEDLITKSEPRDDLQQSADDLAFLFYTGGTTGTPKGVMLSHGNIMANSINFLTQIRADDTLVHLHCGPLFHVAAASRIFSVTQIGGRHMLLPSFSAASVLSAIQRYRVTLATFVPTMMRQLLESPDLPSADLSSLRVVTYGAAPTPEALLRAFSSHLPGVGLVQSYGMTETAPIATMLAAADHVFDGPASDRLRSAGRAALLAEVRIVGPDDAALKVGEIGEVAVRGPMVMRGYWRNPAATDAAIRRGWMHTGDIGYLDAEGYLFVVDRLKDMIITGGENVFSQEVENAIALHPLVRECAVFGKPHPLWGEAVHAVVVPKPGETLTAEQIIAHCRSNIATYKCPKTVEVRDTPLPVSAANKILKTALRAVAIEDQVSLDRPK